MAYDANSIETLSFLDAVRTRVSMYMGSADNQGVLQCIREIITNSIDEATMGFGNIIKVELSEGNRIKIPSFICTLEIIPCYPRAYPRTFLQP